MSAPAVSVVIPVVNEATRLAGCLRALRAQSLPRGRFEVIVVDGESGDGSAAVAAELGARVVSDASGSVSAARNRGIAAARGDVVAFTDADCVPDRRWLEALLDRFHSADASLGGVGGGLRLSGSCGGLVALEDARLRAVYRGFITSNVAYRRVALEATGAFDSALSCGEDWDLCWRVLDAGYRVEFEPAAVVVHAPPEAASWREYLVKQFWYGRRDVPTLVKRARRIVARRRAGLWVDVRESARVAAPAVASGLAVGALAFAPWRPRSALAGAGLLLAVPVAARVAGVARGLPVERPRLAAHAGLQAARCAIRGVGCIAGVVDVARAASSRSFRHKGGVAPRVPRAFGGARSGDAAEKPVNVGPVRGLVRDGGYQGR